MGLEIWGGAEYTFNRVGPRYFDQTEYSGHSRRPSDYQRFAALGIRTLRYGLLWERYENESSWRTFDSHLDCMKSYGLRPIVGLLHHGSGPPHTQLLDPEFPQKLAMYARRVADRYPWIEAYTPVNEPHTTARFSAMYGLWYPHQRSSDSYLRALLAQLKGTVLSMAAIRQVRSDAQLIQTEDVGRISGTEELRSLWELMNMRQWLTFDILGGKVDRSHPMFAYLLGNGIVESELSWFVDNPCPPDIIGINYYATSDRFLDHRVHLYPSHLGSSEGNFVDAEAVRVEAGGIAGIDCLLLEAWRRYKVALAVTEVHLGGAVQEQIRWLVEQWSAVLRVREEGVDCRALTIWALLGSFHWNHLVTHENGYYEPGVFDLSSGTPVVTELANIVEQITRGIKPSHPALSSAGWWRRQDRIRHHGRG
jgi:dTDP-4-dehydrorhamnose reductase